MNNDPYDTGTPKYSTAQDIYDGLCELVQTEEMNILSEMGADVSYDNQTYYYTDKGYELKTKFEELTDYGNSMWQVDLAIRQLDEAEIHDTVYDALINPDLAKRVGFKKLFIEHMLGGDKSKYNKIAEEFFEELSEGIGWGFNRFAQAFLKVARDNDVDFHGDSVYNTYHRFCYPLIEKVNGLKLTTETKLIVDCRAHLTSYDDFIFGLRKNQELYEMLEQQYKLKIAQLQANYDEKLKYLLEVAESIGVQIDFNDDVKLLNERTD